MSLGSTAGLYTAIVVLALLYVVLTLLKAAFRGLSPVGAQSITQREHLGQDSFFRKSLTHPTPLWYSLQLSSLSCLVATTSLLAVTWVRGGEGNPWLGALGTTCLSLLGAILAEFALPRLLVAGREEQVLVAFLGPLRGLHLALSPLSNLLARRGNGATAGDDPDEEEADEEEIKAYIEMGESEGILEEEEKVLIKGVVDFGDAVLKEVMTPRTDVMGVPAGTALGKVRRHMAEALHTRLPVYEENIDSVVGLVYLKDLVRALDEGNENDQVETILRPPLLAPESMKVHDLLRLFQSKRISMAIVMDEYGGTSGIVTMEDLLEEIVGEIQDEHETEEAWIIQEGEGTYSVDGRADLDEISEIVGVPLDFDEVETVGGLVFSRLGYLPSAGEWVDINGLRFHVLESDEKRVYRVRIEPAPTEGADGKSVDRRET